MKLALLPIATVALSAPLLAQGAAPLFSGSVEMLSPARNAQKVLDLDHDGHDDVLSWSWTTAPGAGVPTPTLRLAGLLVDVEGHLVEDWTFVLPAPAGVNCQYTSTAVGDFDGDGFDDFAVNNWGTIHVYLTRAGQPPVLLERIDVASHTSNAVSREIRAANLDGDGYDDIVTATRYKTHGFLSPGPAGVFTYAGTGDLGSSAIRPIVAVVDYDGDGLDEFIVRDVYPDDYSVFGLSGGSYGYEQFVPEGMPFMKSIIAGDIDGDGDVDVVAFDRQGSYPGTYEVHRQTAPGVMTVEPIRMGGPATHFYDVDGDGDLDGLCCGGGPVCDWDNSAATNFEVCLNDGTGVFDHAVAYPGIATGADGLAGVTDLDGDGDVDLVGGRCVLINHTDVGADYCAPPVNSTGGVGQVEFGGSSSLSRADLMVQASGLPAGATVIVLLAGRAGSVPVGASELCLSDPVRRIGVVSADAAGVVDFALDPVLFGATYPGAVVPGATRRFQMWHRDVGVGAFGFSEAGRVTFAP